MDKLTTDGLCPTCGGSGAVPSDRQRSLFASPSWLAAPGPDLRTCSDCKGSGRISSRPRHARKDGDP